MIKDENGTVVQFNDTVSYKWENYVALMRFFFVSILYILKRHPTFVS
jgi:hypothetical protein